MSDASGQARYRPAPGGSFSAGESVEDCPQSGIQIFSLRGNVLAEFVPKAAKNKRPNHVHLGNRPNAIVPAEPRVPLYKRDRRVEQIGKKKRQEQHEESAPSEVIARRSLRRGQ